MAILLDVVPLLSAMKVVMGMMMIVMGMSTNKTPVQVKKDAQMKESVYLPVIQMEVALKALSVVQMVIVNRLPVPLSVIKGIFALQVNVERIVQLISIVHRECGVRIVNVWMEKEEAHMFPI